VTSATILGATDVALAKAAPTTDVAALKILGTREVADSNAPIALPARDVARSSKSLLSWGIGAARIILAIEKNNRLK
jgi:hypothetical protein